MPGLRVATAASSSVQAERERVASPRRDTSSAPALDGPAIDRLADNVMQRIERRIRIERERRGL
jgi:hypothetical protein